MVAAEERFGALRDMQTLIERLVRDDYGVRLKPLAFTLNTALSARCVALPFTLASGETIRKVEALGREIALACGVAEVTFMQDAYGLWVVLPRPNPESVLLRDYLPNGAKPGQVGVAALGVDLHNKLVALDIPAQPHTLLVGTSNAGKSNTLLALLVSLAYWYPPRQVQFYVLDGKGGASFAPLDRYPLKHLRSAAKSAGGTVLRSAPQMLAALREVIGLMEQRYAVRGAGGNEAGGNGTGGNSTSGSGRTLLVVVIDELAEVLRMGGDLLESSLSTILQKGRAAGIHVVASAPKADTQHLGTLASFFNGRIALKAVRPSDAYLAANASSKAHRLGLKGDMYVGAEQRRVQGFQVLPDDIPLLLAPHIINGVAGSTAPGVVLELGGTQESGVVLELGGTQESGVVLELGGAVPINGDGLLSAQPTVATPPTVTAPSTQSAVATPSTVSTQSTVHGGGGRPTKPITDTELTALRAYVAAEGTLPTLSQLVKGKFAQHPAVRPVLEGDARYTLGLLGRGCMAQSRAERLLKLGIEAGL